MYTGTKSIRIHRKVRVVYPTLVEQNIARVLGVNAQGALGRRMVARVISKM